MVEVEDEEEEKKSAGLWLSIAGPRIQQGGLLVRATAIAS